MPKQDNMYESLPGPGCLGINLPTFLFLRSGLCLWRECFVLWRPKICNPFQSKHQATTKYTKPHKLPEPPTLYLPEVQALDRRGSHQE